MSDPTRCKWCLNDPLNIAYHDTEWGVPNRDDAHLFEMLVLEMMEAGLSWILILRKREHFRQAFDRFHAPTIALMMLKSLRYWKILTSSAAKPRLKR